jgi:hypothetical protein
MDSYSKQREAFLVTMASEGLPLYVGRTVLAKANTIQRNATLSCSSEAADRDRVPCPGIKREADCICDKFLCACGHSVNVHANSGAPCEKCTCTKVNPQHETIPRIDRQTARLEKYLTELLAKYNIKPDFQGDPRGCCVKLAVPSGKTDDWGRTGICVPTRDY